MDYLELLKKINQDHIIESYTKSSEQQQTNLKQQLDRLNATYPGGLVSYHERALKLLKDSAQSSNPYKDYTVGKPSGITFHTQKAQIMQKYEHIGLKQFNHVAFVLVAGGLGERLGYPGIKVAIPMQLLTRKRFMHYYIEYILAYQKKYCSEGVKIPLAIMTSDDTHEQTLELLQKNGFFGMQRQQLTIMKQEKVPAMIDNNGRFELKKGKLEIQTKPHGHGDVHTLLYQHNLIQKWFDQNKKWVIFFQDTNPLVFRAYPMLLGVSQEKDYDFNCIACPRKPGEAVGAITTLVHKETGSSLIINVEYNLLEGLFKQSGGQQTDSEGFSVFPGNINSFAIKIQSYNQTLNQTKGHISEFINPKYADESKTKFKSSARLQCLMQDYPKLLPNCEKVGFTDIPKGFCFTTVKNDLATAVDKFKKGLSAESASTCEADFYFFNRQMLRMCGAEIQEALPCDAGDMKLAMFPMVSISPTFATCYTQLKQKIKKLKISARSSLILCSDCVLEDVDVDGHEQITQEGYISLKVQGKDGKQIIKLTGNQQPYLQIRGYDLL